MLAQIFLCLTSFGYTKITVREKSWPLKETNSSYAKLILYNSDLIHRHLNIVSDESSQLSVVDKLNDENTSKSAKLAEKIKIFLYQAFLPQGFPQSVSNDYVEYQIWDTTQVPMKYEWLDNSTVGYTKQKQKCE